MTADGANIALARNFALLRLLAMAFEDDDPPGKASATDIHYFLDANVPLFFADPVGDNYLMKIFGGHSAFELPEVEELEQSEARLLPAFAKNEGDRLKGIIGSRPTHVLRPHRLEIGWKQARLQKTVVSDLASLDDAEREKEKDYIKNIEKELQRASRKGSVDPKSFFDIFLANYLPTMVRKVSTLARMKTIFDAGMLRDRKADIWEEYARADNVLWSFFYERLMAIRPPESAKDVHFNVMQDAEALALICGYITTTSNKSAFLTFDWTIHRVLNDIFNSNAEIKSEIKSKLPEENFARHPIIYTALVSGAKSRAFPDHLRGFIRDIDLLFHRLIRDRRCYRRTLGEVAYRNNLEKISYLLEEGTTEFQKAFQPFVEKLSKDILFVHEESAVNAVQVLLGGVKTTLGDGEADDYLAKGELQSVFDLVNEHIEARSEEKAAALVKTFAAIPFVDADVEAGEPLLVDEARLILSEWATAETSHASLASSASRRTKQLLRNWPGWIRISEAQTALLNEIVDDSETFVNSLLNIPNAIDEEFYLLGALIAAIKNDWVLSERYAIIARSLAENSANDNRLAEARYWVAVSRHYQVDPGLARLVKADRQLERAIDLANAAAKSHDNTIDKLRFRTERAWISALLPYHQYLYGADKYPLNDSDEGRSAAAVWSTLTSISAEFIKTAHVPYDPISLRLGIHIFSGLCLMALFSWGLPPQFGDDKPQPRSAVKRYVDVLRRLCSQSRVTVSLRVQFIIHACDFILNGNSTSVLAIKKLKNMEPDVLIPFDQKMLEDFLILAESKKGSS